jgi:cytochrome P450
MGTYFLAQSNGESSQSIQGLRSIAINVLGQVGYGQPQQWNVKAGPQTEGQTVDEKNALFAAISLMIELLLWSAFVSSSFLQLPFMPSKLRKLGRTKENYPKYARQVLDKERELASQSSQPRDNMVALLTRLYDQEIDIDTERKPTVSSQYLTEEEIRGNLFVFTAAGFDTTANTLGYAITMLAVYPEWQSWIQEELDVVFATISSDEFGEYNAVYPRLVRCFALMVSRPP